MTPDGCRGSFLWLRQRPGPGSRFRLRNTGMKKGPEKIRPNTVIISHSPFQVNGFLSSRGENLCPAQKQPTAFGEHSILKSWNFHVIL